MWGTHVDGDRLRRVDSNTPGAVPTNQWHTVGDAQADADRLHPPTTTHPTEEVEDPDSPEASVAGTWGENDVGRFDPAAAMEDYEALRRNLTEIERTRSRESQASRVKKTRTLSMRSRRSGFSRAETRRSEREPGDVEAGPADGKEEKEDAEEDFELEGFMREGHFEKRSAAGSAKKVGVIYKHLTVKGFGSSASFVRTLPDAILGTFGPDLYRTICRFVPRLARKSGETRELLHDFSGCIRDGEMMLVLGRPGAGCSTFLKVIANNRESYAAVEGDISYGGIPADKQKKMYRGEVNYNPEDDVHFASLSVWQTYDIPLNESDHIANSGRSLTFALMNKTKKKAVGDIPIIANALMRMFGISHTKYTLVGDAYTRGVSGGERKRVSIAETLASKSTVMCWDNSTRGLDASTALDYARSLRIMTDISNRTTLVTLYQAGEGIYDLMDKVLVIDQGREIFMGRREEARKYFIDLGFEAPERQTTADFLTAVTDPVERRFRPGCSKSTPKTPEELERAFRQSPYYQKNLEDIKEYERYLEETNYQNAREFESAVQEGKSKRVPRKSPYTVSYPRQVMACVKREFWLLLGDTTTLYTKLFIIISNGLIVGSLFYGEPQNTEGAFSRGGALFFSILFLGWLQLTELMKAVSGRVVVARHREYAVSLVQYVESLTKVDC